MGSLRGYAPLLDYRYWLNLHPVPLGPSLVGGIFSFFAWFIVASVALWIAARTLKKKDPRLSNLLKRFAGPLLTAGLLGLLCLFCAFEQVPILNIRLWFLLTLVLFAWQTGRAVAFAVQEYPSLRREDAEKHRIEKYLPKKK
ncbi:MAG TPA: hypothetical protein VL426_07145 [Candidatus Binatia bacterium]|jgi:hypothetical protein|nr:hypothetical protein [Candidatus Binatia bacterium]